MITMKEIAERAGVSMATVSYVLNDTGNVSEKTRKLILEIIHKEGYTPNRIAKGLRSRKTNTIGVLVEDVTAFQTPRIINGINSYLESNGYHILLNDLGLIKKTNRDIDRISEFKNHIEESTNLLISAQVDGIIYIAMHDRDVGGILNDLPIPLVFSYCYANAGDYIYVTYDNQNIVSKLTHYLISQNHKEIGVLWGKTESRPAQMRYQSFCETMEVNSLPVKNEYVFYGDWEFESGRKAYEQYKKLVRKPTAIFAMNDLMGLGLMDAALDDGKTLPRDLSIIGFDNNENCRYYRPGLTTVDLPLEKMGYQAGVMISDLVGKRNVSADDVILPCKLIERNSVSKLDG